MKDLLIILTLRILALLPLAQARVLGRWLGSLTFLMHTRMVATTQANLKICYPTLSAQAHQQLVKQSLQHTFQTIVEAAGTWLWPLDTILAQIHNIEGEELLQQAQARGKGVVLIAPHLGNWELLGLYLNSCGLGQTHQMYQPPKSAGLDHLIRQARSRAGANMVPTDKTGVAALLKALRKGEIVGILPDQVPPLESGDFAPFFGQPVLTMTLISRLQQKTGAVVLAGYARREKQGFSIVIKAADPKVYAEHIQDSLTGVNRTIEHLIAEVPAQYQWDYKRFKRLPAGVPSPYLD